MNIFIFVLVLIIKEIDESSNRRRLIMKLLKVIIFECIVIVCLILFCIILFEVIFVKVFIKVINFFFLIYGMKIFKKLND